MPPTVWTQAELDILVNMWPEHPSTEVTAELAKLGMFHSKTASQVKTRAYVMGLRHTPEATKRIRRECLIKNSTGRIGAAASKARAEDRKAGCPKDAWLTAAPVKNTITRERVARGVIVTTHRLGG